MATHHGQCADARANPNDSLYLLALTGDIYAHADDANRRLCNQTFFKAIYIDEDRRPARDGVGAPRGKSNSPRAQTSRPHVAAMRHRPTVLSAQASIFPRDLAVPSWGG